MKECRCCKIEKEAEEYYKRPSNLDGLYSYCKECTRKHNKEAFEQNREKYKKVQLKYRKKNKKYLRKKALEYYYENKEEVLKKSEVYRNENKKKISLREAKKRLSEEDRFEKNRKKHLKWAKDNRDVLNEYQREWYQKNKEKRRAHVVLNRAIKAGKIMRPENCSECHKECKPDGHHTDYSQPLNVDWICRACHSRKSPRTVII